MPSRRWGFDPWVRKIPWRRKWQPTPVFLYLLVVLICISLITREFQKNIYFCFIDYAKAFDCVDHKKLWKILKKMGIPNT